MRDSMLSRPLRANQSGATAIEYALIAGLIAVGILSSLVGTRSSLNGAFGSVSSGLAGNTSSPSASTGQLSSFQNKTQTNYTKTVAGSSTTYVWTYSDGSTATFAYYPTGTYAQRITMTDKTNNIKYSYVTDSSGNITGFNDVPITSSGNALINYYSSNGDFVNGSPSVMRTQNYDTSGNSTGAPTSSAPTADYLSLFSLNQSNFQYYKNLAGIN